MPSPDQSESRSTNSGLAQSGSRGSGMSSSLPLPLSSIEELAEQLRARSESNNEGEDVTLVSGGDNSPTSDDGDISPTSSGSSSSSSTSSECEGEWEDEWSSFQAAYDDHVHAFWSDGDASYFDNPALGGISSVHDSGDPVLDTTNEPDYLNNAELGSDTGASLNTSTDIDHLSIDIADHGVDQEQAHADTPLPTINPFPPQSPSKRKRKRTGKQPRDGALTMRILALWNLRLKNESLALAARANAAKTELAARANAAKTEEMRQGSDEA